ncbi:S26 family signal peptidase [Micromonospora sp. URMC 103]|uniref:S26 family signal peptidase n=1 Tax=Micromonospora sp. URMC 103 TaxID=3423406 RepID=UPI003F1DDE24
MSLCLMVVPPLALLLGAIGWIRRRLIVTEVHGPSMLPTYRDGDRLLTRRRAGRERLSTGQVVVLRNPRPPGLPGSSTGPWLVKRIVAVAGDRLPPGMPGGHVPDGYVLVLGDNLAQSLDSRHLGPIPTRAILGTVVRRMGGRRPAAGRGTADGEPGRSDAATPERSVARWDLVEGVDIGGPPV